jgi:2-dehydropantoate 2-reductase
MEIIVIGAGAIGSLYGAKLAAANDVTLVARPAHVAAINQNGLRIDGLESQRVALRATTSVETIGPNALVLVTTKVGDTGAAMNAIVEFVRDDTTIVCLQNGLESDKVVRRLIGSRGVVLRALTQFGAILESPGVIQFMARGYTILEGHERSQRLAAVLNAAGLDCRISANISRDVWHKLIINCVVNPITSILGCEVGRIADPQLNPLKEMVIAECLAVAASEDVVFEENLREEIDDFFRPSRNIVSMLQDLRRGRKTEIDYLNGAVVALGQDCGIPTPVNAALTSIIKALEARSLVPQEVLEPEPA